MAGSRAVENWSWRMREWIRTMVKAVSRIGTRAIGSGSGDSTKGELEFGDLVE